MIGATAGTSQRNAPTVTETNGTFYLASDGWPKAIIPPPYSSVADFLGAEIQGVEDNADAWLKQCHDVKHGKEHRYDYSGNLFFVDVNRTKVRLTCQIECGISDSVIPIDRFIAYLTDWKNLLRNRTPR